MIKNKAHAKFSASGSDRWLNCPGSIQLSADLPPSPTNPAAYEGTIAHAVLEKLAKNRKHRGKTLLEIQEKGVTFENDQGKEVTEPVPPSMLIHAEMTLNYIESRLRELDGAELLVEEKCALPVSEPDQFGTSDIVILQHFGKLIVMDYKYGHKLVHPKENPQMLYYALGVAHRYDYNFSDVELVIIQPRAQLDGEWIRTWNTKIETLLEYREKFDSAIRKAKSKNAPLVSGKHCDYCVAAFKCPEIKNRNLKTAQVDFGDDGSLSLPDVTAPSIVANLPEILPALEKLETWIEAVRKHAFEILSSGRKIQGYTLKEKRGVRKWVNPKIAEIEAIKAFGYLALSPPELLSPAQLEKLGEKQKAFVEKNAALVSSGLTLARDSGKPSAEKEFTD